MYVKKCAHCGAEFEAGKGNQKYCGIDCRIAAQKILRADWEEKTNYLEKRRHANELKRQRITEEQYQERQKQRKKDQANRKRQLTRKRNKEQQELEKQAGAGDLRAVMRIACENMSKIGNNTSAEYWLYYKQFVTANAEINGMISGIMVNGVSLYDDNFEQRVVDTIQQTGKIIATGKTWIKPEKEEGGLIPCRTK